MAPEQSSGCQPRRFSPNMGSYEKRQKRMLMEEIVDRLVELEELGYPIEEILEELGDKYVHPEEPEDMSDLDVHLHHDDEAPPERGDSLDSIMPGTDT